MTTTNKSRVSWRYANENIAISYVGHPWGYTSREYDMTTPVLMKPKLKQFFFFIVFYPKSCVTAPMLATKKTSTAFARRESLDI